VTRVRMTGHRQGVKLMRNRGALLLTILAVALVAAACGRATEEQINQALGITPTPTPSQDDLATATAQAEATEAARQAALASPSGAEAAVALGDVVRGRSQFTTNCMGCHGPGGRGPALLEAGGPGVDITLDQMMSVVRDGTGHPTPPGPYPQSRVADSAIRDITAYILSEANE
jgi:mono/diheme cytochrome c family protein